MLLPADIQSLDTILTHSPISHLHFFFYLKLRNISQILTDISWVYFYLFFFFLTQEHLFMSVYKKKKYL